MRTVGETARVWQARSGGFPSRWEDAAQAVLAVLWLTLLSSPIWAQGRPDILWMQGGHWGVNSVGFSPDGQYLASGGG